MSKREFIRQNRAEIDQAIGQAIGDPYYRLNDREREQWIMNDEAMYRWARFHDVKL